MKFLINAIYVHCHKKLSQLTIVGVCEVIFTSQNFGVGVGMSVGMSVSMGVAVSVGVSVSVWV